MFNFGPTAPSVATLRDGFTAKRYAVFGEVGIQYQGVSPSDPRFEPYLALAEAADVPLGIHIGIGPPGAPYFQGLGNYRARLHSPLELEEALASRHPKLRVYIMHAGWPCSTIFSPCCGRIRKCMSTLERFASLYRERSFTTIWNGSSTPGLVAG